MTSEAREVFPAPPEEQVGDEPVRRLAHQIDKRPEPGTALCLSGGGYRAMLFHVGVLWRLNEQGILGDLQRISSVSGGSITAGVLAMNWGRLGFDEHRVAAELGSQVVDPVRRMAAVSIDVTSVLAGLALASVSISQRVESAYRKHLFGDTTLQDLPDEPRFVLNATNIESGALMRFSKPYLADYRVGRVNRPEVALALAVAASSAFPPFLSPCTVDLSHEEWVSEEGNDLIGADFRGRIALSDGGVYDNLGIETAWKNFTTILVSDAGGHLGADASPPADWGRHLLRVLSVIDNQVRSLRKRQVIDSLVGGTRTGMYVGIRSDPAHYGLPDPILVDPDVRRRLAAVPTRLTAVPDDLQEELINWGYAICDTGLRAHLTPGAGQGDLPYPGRPLSGA